jgi:hypothetical protein
VDKGWKYLLQAINWFRENSQWLIPVLKNVAILFGAWTLVIQPLSGIIFSLLNPLNLVIVAIAGIGLAIWKARTDWLGFRRMLEGMEDWLLGTKWLDPQNKGYGVMRAFPKGVVPRAMPVQQGWVRQMFTAVAEQFSHWMDVDLPNWLGLLGQKVWAWLIEQGPKVGKWIDDQIKGQREALLKFFDPLVESAKSAGKFITDFIIDPIANFMKGWGDFWNSLPDWLKGGTSGGNVIPKPSTGQPSDTSGKGGHVWLPTAPSPTGPIRAMTYGPLSQGATAADQRQIYGATIAGQKIRLQSNRSAAISPNLLGAYPLGSWVDEYNSKGQLIRHRRIEDTSWIRKGVPTYNSIENYNDIDIGRVTLKRSPIQGPATDTELRNARTGSGGVTLNYNPEIHFHGVDDEAGIHSRLAQHHRRAVDQFQKMLAEAVYMRNRNAFDGAHAV